MSRRNVARIINSSLSQRIISVFLFQTIRHIVVVLPQCRKTNFSLWELLLMTSKILCRAVNWPNSCDVLIATRQTTSHATPSSALAQKKLHPRKIRRENALNAKQKLIYIRGYNFFLCAQKKKGRARLIRGIRNHRRFE